MVIIPLLPISNAFSIPFLPDNKIIKPKFNNIIPITKNKSKLFNSRKWDIKWEFNWALEKIIKIN